jgi:hypothetical protein
VAAAITVHRAGITGRAECSAPLPPQFFAIRRPLPTNSRPLPPVASPVPARSFLGRSWLQTATGATATRCSRPASRRPARDRCGVQAAHLQCFLKLQMQMRLPVAACSYQRAVPVELQLVCAAFHAPCRLAASIALTSAQLVSPSYVNAGVRCAASREPHRSCHAHPARPAGRGRPLRGAPGCHGGSRLRAAHPPGAASCEAGGAGGS